MDNFNDPLFSEKLAMAKRYREYLLGHAYIPYQDLGKYGKSFNEIYNN